MADTDWQREYLESIKKSLDRLEDKFDNRVSRCNARFKSLEQGKVQQIGFVSGVCVCVIVMIKAIEMALRLLK